MSLLEIPNRVGNARIFKTRIKIKAKVGKGIGKSIRIS